MSDVDDDLTSLDEDIKDGIIPGLDLGLGEDDEISGGDDLAEQDEENMYGNDASRDDE